MIRGRRRLAIQNSDDAGSAKAGKEIREQEVVVAKAELTVAKAELTVAEAKLVAAQGDTVEMARANRDVARAEVSIAKADLAKADLVLANADPSNQVALEAAANVFTAATNKEVRAESKLGVADATLAVEEAKVLVAGAAAGVEQTDADAELAAAMERLEIARKVPQLGTIGVVAGASPTGRDISLLKIKGTGKGASSFSQFSNDTIGGFAYLPFSARFDPTPGQRIHGQLVPAPDTQPSDAPIPLIGEGPELSPLKEDDFIKPGLDAWFTKNGMGTSTKLTGAERLGFATGTVDAFTPDGSNEKGGILEIKGAEASLFFALKQGALYSSGVARAQQTKGVAPNEICVPVAGTNGWAIQFGATFMISPSLPIYMTISKAFDLSSKEDNIEARKFWGCFLRKGSQEPPKQARGSPRRLPAPDMMVDGAQYWIKEYTPEVLERGLGLFSKKAENDDVRFAQGLQHMIGCLNRLYESEAARQVAVFPMSVISQGARAVEEGSDDERNCTVPLLVFPNLRAQGFDIGVPDHEDKALFESYVQAVETAVAAIHAAGVAHLDLYTSNIMHRVKDGQVEVKIIDWDSAHIIGDQPGSKDVQDELLGSDTQGGAVIGKEHDELYVAALRKTGSAQLWGKLTVKNSKSNMDEAFFELLNE